LLRLLFFFLIMFVNCFIAFTASLKEHKVGVGEYYVGSIEGKKLTTNAVATCVAVGAFSKSKKLGFLAHLHYSPVEYSVNDRRSMRELQKLSARKSAEKARPIITKMVEELVKQNNGKMPPEDLMLKIVGGADEVGPEIEGGAGLFRNHVFEILRDEFKKAYERDIDTKKMIDQEYGSRNIYSMKVTDKGISSSYRLDRSRELYRLFKDGRQNSNCCF